MIAEMPHGYFKGSLTAIPGAIKSSSVQYNTILLEPMNEDAIELGYGSESSLSKIDVIGHKHKGMSGRVCGTHGITPTITTNKGDGLLIGEPIIKHTYRIRKLTERETLRLMGVDDNNIDKIRKAVSKSRCYVLAGNSIVVDVLYYILRQLYIGNFNKYQQTELF